MLLGFIGGYRTVISNLNGYDYHIVNVGKNSSLFRHLSRWNMRMPMSHITDQSPMPRPSQQQRKSWLRSRHNFQDARPVLRMQEHAEACMG